MIGNHPKSLCAALSHKLGLRDCLDWAQDWPLEAADSSRVAVFFAYYDAHKKDMSDEERRAVVDLIICSSDDSMSGMSSARCGAGAHPYLSSMAALITILTDEFCLHIGSIRYWARVDQWGVDNDGGFELTPLVRAVYEKQADHSRAELFLSYYDAHQDGMDFEEKEAMVNLVIAVSDRYLRHLKAGTGGARLPQWKRIEARLNHILTDEFYTYMGAMRYWGRIGPWGEPIEEAFHVTPLIRGLYEKQSDYRRIEAFLSDYDTRKNSMSCLEKHELMQLIISSSARYLKDIKSGAVGADLSQWRRIEARLKPILTAESLIQLGIVASSADGAKA